MTKLIIDRYADVHNRFQNFFYYFFSGIVYQWPATEHSTGSNLHQGTVCIFLFISPFIYMNQYLPMTLLI